MRKNPCTRVFRCPATAPLPSDVFRSFREIPFEGASGRIELTVGGIVICRGNRLENCCESLTGGRPYGWIGPGFRVCRQIHLGIDNKKALPFEGRAFLCLLVKLFGLDRFARANACAGAAVDALVRIDYINITGRDCLYRTFVDTCAASYAQIGTNFVSHFFVLFKLCVDGANIKIYLIISKPV